MICRTVELVKGVCKLQDCTPPSSRNMKMSNPVFSFNLKINKEFKIARYEVASLTKTINELFDSSKRINTN